MRHMTNPGADRDARPEPQLPLQEYLLGQGLTHKTASNYMREVVYAETWFLNKGRSLDDALPSELIEYANTRPNSPSIRAHLRCALKYWWEWRGIDGWPAAIPVPTVPAMTCKALDDDDARRLLLQARETGWRAGVAVECLLGLALRNEECAAMRWDGFDENMEWYTLTGKGSRIRTLPVVPELADTLARHQTDSPWIFQGRFDGHVTHATIWNWVTTVASEAGIADHVWPHRLRHTALAIMNDETKDLRTTQAFAGHARPTTTAGYTRTNNVALRAASEALRQRLGSITGEHWLHASLPGGQPRIQVGTGDEYGSIQATCDPPGETDDRPYCWMGPDRQTLEDALADGRNHAPNAAPEILTISWPSRVTWVGPLGGGEPPTSDVSDDVAPVVVLRPATVCGERLGSGDHELLRQSGKDTRQES